jgi:hypothetical protein
MLYLTKSQVFKLVSEKAPEYLSFFSDLKSEHGGWLRWPKHFLDIKENLKLHNCVVRYQDQRQIDVSLFFYLMGEKGFHDWNDSLKGLDEREENDVFQEQAQFWLEITSEEIDELFPDFPENLSSEEKSIHLAAYQEMPEEEKRDLQFRLSHLVMHVFLSVHNLLSVMVNGEKMTSLIPKAVNGDDDSFKKAVKIDRSLLSYHPYFIERYQKAQANCEAEFLRRLSHNHATPSLTGKISYPGLYIVFAMLESLGWLDNLTHSEILDICDAAGLDRWQNRIEDVNYVTKRLKGYRNYQKTSGVSMH